MAASADVAEPSPDGPHLVVGDQIAMTSASTRGVRLFERRPTVHCVLLGRARLHAQGVSVVVPGAIAVPANTLHRLSLDGEHACVAYLDPRRYRFEDAARLAEKWQGFVPGQDDLREAVGEADAPDDRHARRAAADLACVAAAAARDPRVRVQWGQPH